MTVAVSIFADLKAKDKRKSVAAVLSAVQSGDAESKGFRVAEKNSAALKHKDSVQAGIENAKKAVKPQSSAASAMPKVDTAKAKETKRGKAGDHLATGRRPNSAASQVPSKETQQGRSKGSGKAEAEDAQSETLMEKHEAEHVATAKLVEENVSLQQQLELARAELLAVTEMRDELSSQLREECAAHAALKQVQSGKRLLTGASLLLICGESANAGDVLPEAKGDCAPATENRRAALQHQAACARGWINRRDS